MVKTDLKNMMILSLFSEPLFESQCLGHTCLAFIIGKVLPQFKDLSSSHVVGPLLSGEALQLYSFVTFQRWIGVQSALVSSCEIVCSFFFCDDHSYIIAS